MPLVGGGLAVFGYVASHDPGRGLALSNRGWLTIAAAAIVAALVAARRGEGLGQLLRTVAEYAVVAALAVLLATAAPDWTARPAHGAGAGCPPVVQVRAWVSCLWQQASQAAKSNAANP